MMDLPDRRQIREARRPLPPPTMEPLLPNVLYLCQLCGSLARYPKLKQHTFRFPFGKTWTVDYVTPMVCINCRMMRHPEVVKLGDGRRRFWKRAIAIWLGESYPSMGPKMFKLLVLRIWLAREWRRLWDD